MPATLRFSKMHGLGNDFALLEGISRPLPPLPPRRVRQLADRHTGIGFDQLLLLLPSQRKGSDFRYRIFNADGGEVGQCGNGARCAHAFLHRRRLTKKRRLNLYTATTRISTQAAARGKVRALMPPAKIMAPQRVGRRIFQHLDIGNPHYICFAAAPDDALLGRLGAALNKAVAGGVNVGFAVCRADGMQLRVYERGVGLTAACGSGALAAAVAAIHLGKAKSPLQVAMPGGCLMCGVERDGGIWMEGEVAHVFDGMLQL